MTPAELKTKAWIGDAVLALYARSWILKQPDIPVAERAETFIRMTSNQFLASRGEPTAMEAEIGEIYESQSLGAAFAHIESTWISLFKKQQANRRKTGTHRKPAKKT